MLKATILWALSLPLYVGFLLIQLKRKTQINKIMIASLFFFYIIAVLSVTFFPFPVQQSVIASGIERQNLHPNFIPFKSILTFWNSHFAIIAKQIGGNILIGIPLGLFIPLLLVQKKSLSKAFLIGVLFFLGIELSQYLLSLYLGYTYRITDIDDVILNSIVFLIGFGLWKFFTVVGARWNKDIKTFQQNT